MYQKIESSGFEVKHLPKHRLIMRISIYESDYLETSPTIEFNESEMNAQNSDSEKICSLQSGHDKGHILLEMDFRALETMNKPKCSLYCHHCNLELIHRPR